MKKKTGFSLPALVFGLIFSLYFACRAKTPGEPSTNDAPLTILTSVTASPAKIGIGGSTRVIAIVVDENAEPVSGRVVAFSADAGTITPADTTNSLGVAEAIYTAPPTYGTITIRARLAEQTDSTTVTIDAQVSQNLRITAREKRLYANGFSSTLLQIEARDANQNPVPGKKITLSTSVGQLPPFVTTDSSGLATADLVSVPSRSDLLATIRASAEEAEAFEQVIFTGVNFSLETSAASLIADGKSSAIIRAVLKETGSTVAIENADIRFGSSLGTIPATVTTDARGVAEAELISSVQTGVATVIAAWGPYISDTLRITMGESVPTYLSLTANPTVLIADTRSQAEIKAVVSDSANNPVPDGTHIRFEIIAGSGTIESRKSTTDGIAISMLTSSSTPDSVWVGAEVAGLRDTVLVRYVVGPAANISISADSSSLPADGKTTTAVRAVVTDAVGNPVEDGTIVDFSASIGDITSSAETQDGVATVTFSSSVTGLAQLTAKTGTIQASTTINLLPGPPNSILLTYDPTSLGVKDSGRNTALTITAEVRDDRNNPVADGTYVAFRIVSAPGGGEFISTDEPVPTINGKAQVSLNSGIRSGTVRVRAEVVDATGRPITPVISATSTDVIIHAGPPFIADVNDVLTSRLSVGSKPLNMFGWFVVNDTVTVVAVVGDKYNNPVPAGTAVYFTTSGGIISTHTGYTDEQGIVTVTLHSGQPYPTVPLFYNTFLDPNAGHPDFNKPTAVIPGPIPDYEGGIIDNGYDATSQNNGIARVLAVTEGVDANGNPARVWGVTNVVFSGPIATFYTEVSDTSIAPGEGAEITIFIYDENGNPIVPGSLIIASSEAGKLSWTEVSTGDPGATRYSVVLVNNLDPNDPDSRETTTSVSIRVESKNGTVVTSTVPITLTLN